MDGTKEVSKVNVGGQEIDLGSSITVDEAMKMLDNLGMGEYTAGTVPKVTGSTLEFEMVNGEKGNK